MLVEAGAGSEHAENFADFVRSIEGVEAAVYFTELAENRFKISLRSKGRVDVERVAATLEEGDIETLRPQDRRRSGFDQRQSDSENQEHGKVRIMNGVILIDKPSGRTSYDMIERLKKVPGIRKAGHTGTLDPLATGVLPVCINEGTSWRSSSATITRSIRQPFCSERRRTRFGYRREDPSPGASRTVAVYSL